MGSAQGGVEIEQLAADDPAAIVAVLAHPHLGLLDHQARRMAFALGLGDHLEGCGRDLQGPLSRSCSPNDADLVEINPLADRARAWAGRAGRAPGAPRRQDHDRRLGAARATPSLEAMRDLDEEDPVDVEARAAGLSFIRLDGDIGCMVNGAGLAMTTMDLVKRAGGQPANFLDIGGGARARQGRRGDAAHPLRPLGRAVLVNIFGGIARGDEVARGLVEARAQQDRDVPMVVRIVGTNADLAADILRERRRGHRDRHQSLDEAVEQGRRAREGAA